jgi:phosphatidylglycerophosphate synthase
MERGTLLSVPNAVSLSRLVFAALFVAIREPFARMGLILAASITDVLDGWLARRLGAPTRIGAMIDPIADRFFTFTVVCTYLFEGMITSTDYFVLISRDLMTAIGFVVARSVSWLRPIVFRARPSGKITTALQLLTLVAVLALPNAVPKLIPLVALASLYSVIDYTLGLWRERAR